MFFSSSRKKPRAVDSLSRRSRAATCPAGWLELKWPKNRKHTTQHAIKCLHLSSSFNLILKPSLFQISHNIILPVTSSYFQLLPVTSSYFILLHVTSCYFHICFPLESPCFPPVLQFFTMFSRHAVSPAASQVQCGDDSLASRKLSRKSLAPRWWRTYRALECSKSPLG